MLEIVRELYIYRNEKRVLDTKYAPKSIRKKYKLGSYKLSSFC